MSTLTETRPLEGLRVLDLSQYVAGPYCARLLAEQGAAVLKVEPPDGDPVRAWPPFSSLDAEAPGLLFSYVNHGKETITLDLSSAEGQAEVLEHARNTDIVVESFRPGTLDRFGLGWDVLHKENPSLLLTSITNFGQNGPYRDYRAWDIVIDALGGLAYIHGLIDGSPLTHGNPQAQYRAGVVAASATVAGLLNRDDVGEHIDVSIMEVESTTLRDTIPQYTYMGAVRRRSRTGAGGPGSITPCADGWVIPSGFGGSYSLFANFMGIPELADERFETGEGRQRHAAELAELFGDTLAKWNAVEFFEGAQSWGLGVGIVLTPKQAIECQQFLARGFLEEIETGVGRTAAAPRGAIAP